MDGRAGARDGAGADRNWMEKGTVMVFLGSGAAAPETDS